MARDLIAVIEQTSGNVWFVNADDPETAVCDTISAIDVALEVSANTSRTSVGQPGYVPYCCGCSTMMRMHRDEVKQAFVCRSCGLETRRVNGEDMFDRTARAGDA